jgi:SAM-dependent methyltransferase
MHAWLDHPSILAHYGSRGLLAGQSWREWVKSHFDGPAQRILELGCGSGSLSLELFRLGSTRDVEGMDASAERVQEAEKRRVAAGVPGGFRVEDVNRLTLTPERYDLIVSSHSFHHFLDLEHVMGQVAKALTPRGLFILEEFVGPTQFQWTDAQIDITRSLMALIPEQYRMLRWPVVKGRVLRSVVRGRVLRKVIRTLVPRFVKDELKGYIQAVSPESFVGAVKPYEGRPTVAEVVAASPFESIRSAEIVPLFERHFRVLHRRNLGGTIQHLLYNGIIHNFPSGKPEAEAILRGIYEAEDALIDSGLLPSDFQLLVGGGLLA